MTSTLVVGWSPNNLAEQFSEALNERRQLGTPDAPHSIQMASQDWLDVTKPVQVMNRLVSRGPFDEIVYCAAVNELRWLKDITLDDLMRVFAANYFGWVNLLATHERLYPQHLKRAVAVTSDAAYTPMRGSLMYNSSKAALAFSIRNLARELAPHTVVVGVAPCIIDDTPMTEYIDATIPGFRGWTEEHARAYEQSNIPLGRRLTKDEVVEAMLFALTGPESLTGSTIQITGGK